MTTNGQQKCIGVNLKKYTRARARACVCKIKCIIYELNRLLILRFQSIPNPPRPLH